MSNLKRSLGKAIDLSILVDPATKGKDQTGGVPYSMNLRDLWVNEKWGDVVHHDRNLKIRRWLGSSSGTLHEELIIACHYGTHIDSVFHIDADGPDLTQIPFDTFHGNAVIVSLPIQPKTEATEITGSQLEELNLEIQKGDWVLLFTKEYAEECAILTVNACNWLLEREILGIGMDFSIKYGKGAHNLLHEHGLVMIEGLESDGIRSIKGDEVFLITAPLKVKGLGASPCRSMAFEYI